MGAVGKGLDSIGKNVEGIWPKIKSAVNSNLKPPKRNKPPRAPDLPDQEASDAQKKARDRIRERAIRFRPTRLTGPSGLTTKATLAPKTLLGA